jgi:hypothetical protein
VSSQGIALLARTLSAVTRDEEEIKGRMSMYLVRSIQCNETAPWVDQLGVDPTVSLPLPGVPRRQFNKVIVIHGPRALEFELDHIQRVHRTNVVVGSRGAIVIKAMAHIYVKVGTRHLWRASIRGFTGIRYTRRRSAVAF